MTESLHIKYRPHSWGEVIGQDVIVKALSKMIERQSSQAFVLTGSSGVGKTSLARIAAVEFGCLQKDLLEIDAATYTGIDAMRQVQETLQYLPFGQGAKRAVIIDEAHMLSKSAWNSLLKPIEEPPKHVCWFFCTTESSKIPNTIKTRCATFTLKLIPEKILGELFDNICESEKINLTDDIGDLIIREANGSARQMLVNLEACHGAKSTKEAAAILETALQSDVVLELCRFIINASGSWTKVMNIISKLDGENPESVRIIIVNYLASALKAPKSDKEALRLLEIMDSFSSPYVSSERMAPLLLSIGRVIFAGR